MKYTVINPFGQSNSRGTFDDFYSTEKYKTKEEAYEKKDYIHVDYVVDENNTVYLEAHNVKNPEVKKYHQLMIQHFPVGIDMYDDQAGCEMAVSLF